MNKGQWIAVSILVVIVIAGVSTALWGLSTRQQNVASQTVLKDRDTGESLDLSANTVETGGSGVETGTRTLFGIEPFAKRLVDENQKVGFISSVQQALWRFGEARLGKEFASLTLRPQGLTITTTSVTGTVRLGQSDTIIPIAIQISSTGAVAIVTLNKDSSQYDGTYVYVGGIDAPERLLFTVTQKNDTSADLVIDTENGYRDAALEFIESLGYKVVDMNITFSDYESPYNV